MYKKLLLYPSKDLPITKNICTTFYITDYITLAWDKRKLNFNPNWKDFWNVTQYPGKRGLQKDAVSALSIALMADNVPAGKVSAALSSPQGVKRAFRKLTQLRPYIVWWTTPKDATLLLKNNHVLMSSASALNIQHNTSLKNMPPLQIQTNYILENNLSWGIPINIKPSKKQQMLENYSIKSLKKTNILDIRGKSIIKEDVIFLQQTQSTLENQFDQWLFLTNTSHNNNENRQNPLD
ncbi:extracellular solute-binding protein [Commensalibacter oyaizuii]|uniref:Extracellular solute-binding protein n=1 Tax=Commensalibacter oyaizuii TaxID=3043873 RepID=A0ABT6Q1X3_9PROT|nr:extracellular solute-binding protein [Commensalibacter sp. TBRC 16381]MDI2091074.1 extracellular solute-binding protein [Commensalibacter sp. TBRC 16381]